MNLFIVLVLIIRGYEVIYMGFKLACKDLGSDCTYVAKGETMEEVMEDGAKHGKEVHGYTDEQLNDPQMIEKIKAAIKQD